MNPRWTSLLVLACFFLSGVAGLVYQVAWSRYLALFLGHTSFAVVAVLVAFMGGLALGNAILGKWADRVGKPLALYAWLEIGIGVYALVFPHYNGWVHSAYISAASNFAPGSIATVILKFGFSLLTILAPTVMMGATFPALVKFVTHSLGELRSKVALLYFINSAGAVGGALVAEFYWLPNLGLQATVYASAALNLAVGALTLWWSARFASRPVHAATATAGNGEERFTEAELRLAVWGIGLSGFVAMLYEVAWTRLLALVIGSSNHAFTIMLVTFISGIALGSAIVAGLKQVKDSLAAFAWAELALAASVLATMPIYDDLPFWFSGLAKDISRQPQSFYLYQLAQSLLCFLVMFIPTLCLGMTLPFVSRIATSKLESTGQSVGRVFAVNTVGTVLGAAVTGLLIMPALGLARTFGLGIALNAFIGASILAHRAGKPISRVVIATAAGALLLTFLAGEFFSKSWSQVFASGIYRTRLSREGFKNYWANSSLIYYKDGASSSVGVMKTERGTNVDLALKVNGKADASSGGDAITQMMIAHLPLLFKPDSERVLIVGLGSGMTAAAALRHTNILRVDTVELSREVCEAAALFGPWNDNVLSNPRLNLVQEDAKTFLQVSGEKYDVIVSEPSNPWMAGVAGVFTREYYLDCLSRLKEGGIMVQWVQIYETSDEAIQTVLATFSSVYPFTGIWRALPGDLILLGTTSPPNIDLEKAAEIFQRAPISEHFATVRLNSFPLLLAHEFITPRHGAFLAPDETMLHTDNFPVLEQHAQVSFFVGSRTAHVHQYRETLLPRAQGLLGEWLSSRPLTVALCAQFADFNSSNGILDEETLRSLLLGWEKLDPASTVPMEVASLQSLTRWRHEVEALAWRPRQDEFIALAEKDPHPLRLYTLSLLRVHRLKRSVFHVPETRDLEACLQRLIETDSARVRLYSLQLAELAWDRGEDDLALKLGLEALDPRALQGAKGDYQFDPAAPYQVLGRLARILMDQKKLDELRALAIHAAAAGWFNPSPAMPKWVELLQREIQTMPLDGAVAPLPRL